MHPPSNLPHPCSSSNHPELFLEKGQYLLDSTMSSFLVYILYQDRGDMMILQQDHRVHSMKRYGHSWNSITNSLYTVIHDCWFKLHNMTWCLHLSPSLEILYLLQKDALQYQLDNLSFRFLNFFMTDMPCDLACVCIFFLLSWGPLENRVRRQFKEVVGLIMVTYTSFFISSFCTAMFSNLGSV